MGEYGFYHENYGKNGKRWEMLGETMGNHGKSKNAQELTIRKMVRHDEKNQQNLELN
jgi:hypothetical protein